MEIHLYTVCWNEARMLGFFFRHYEPFVSRFVVYDDGSTDGSLELLRAEPKVEVRPFPRSHPDSFALSEQALKDECWKESRGRADWVIVTAIDEHLVHPRLGVARYLERCRRRGITYVPALGFQMMTREFPAAGEHLARTQTKGAPFAMMSKLRVFDPDAIEEVSFGVGGHSAAPTGRLRLPWRDELLLLHYKLLGLDYARARNAELRARLGARDHSSQWGDHTRAERVEEEWAWFSERLVDLSREDYVPWLDHYKGRWWRPPGDPASRARDAVGRARRLVTRKTYAERGRTEL